MVRQQSAGIYTWLPLGKRVLDKVNAALKVALKDPEFIKREEALGAVIVTDARVSIREHGFGGFISGSSRTADIEQSLVMGAHGAMAALVIFV